MCCLLHYKCFRFGSVVMIKSDLGIPIIRYIYDDHGNIRTVELTDMYSGVDVTALGTDNPIRWRGHYYDSETGLYYIDGRYYDPWEGIYLDAVDIPTAISEMYLDRNGITYPKYGQLRRICTFEAIVHAAKSFREIY